MAVCVPFGAAGAGLSVIRVEAGEESSMPTKDDTVAPNAKPDQTTDGGGGKSRTGTSPSYLGQSSPSSGVISVSLCTTTLVTDMSGCCSLASFMA